MTLALAVAGLSPAVVATAAPTVQDPAPRVLSAGVGPQTCALTPDGDADCWGANQSGQGDQEGPFVAVGVGDGHTCALTPSGSVHCWGNDGFGQATDQPGPYTALSVGHSHTCGLTPGGAADCWGWNNKGQAEDRGGPFVAISAGTEHTCGLTLAETAECWGNELITLGTHAGPYSAISAGEAHTCALTHDGAADCWGPVGNAAAADQVGPFTAIETGDTHSCGLTSTGAADCWGALSDQAGPYVILSAGGKHACGLTPSHDIDCWGGGGEGADQAGPYGFPSHHELSVSSSGAGTGTVTSSPPGIDCGTTCAEYFGIFSSVILTAEPAADSDFAGWSGACSGSDDCVVTMDEVVSVTASWVIDQTPPDTTIDAGPSGIATSAEATFYFSADESVTVFGCRLDGGSWAACNGGTVTYLDVAEGPHTFDVRAVDWASNVDPTPASASWTVVLPHALTVTRDGSGAGSVTSSLAGIDCPTTCSSSFDGQATVTLTATPAAGSVFIGWAGAGCSGTGGCVVSMSEARSVHASFALAVRPDGRIAAWNRPMRGDDVYNLTGADQTVRRSMRLGHQAIFVLRLQNDGATTDSFLVTGPGAGRTFGVRYVLAGQNVTRKVTTEGLRLSDVTPASSRTIRVFVRAGSQGGVQRWLQILVSSRTTPSSADLVRAHVRSF